MKGVVIMMLAVASVTLALGLVLVTIEDRLTFSCGGSKVFVENPDAAGFTERDLKRLCIRKLADLTERR